jgi:sigma-B regulation protein RsbU (phosphoserine phosphatase)
MTINLQDLRESNEFLNLVLDNVGSAVLIADENLQIHQFNGSFLDLFDMAAEFPVAPKTFGEVSGCVNAVRENKHCGETSQCAHCVLRHSLIQTLIAGAPVDRRPLHRTFTVRGRAVDKYLRFTTRRVGYQGRAMTLVIIDDVTDIEQQKRELERRQRLIEQDLKAAADIQRCLLPEKRAAVMNLQTAWRFAPCGRIGGDTFNIVPVDERRAGLYMLDVCGHGVPAAMISVAASQFLLSGRGLLGSGCELTSPETVLNHLDEEFPFERFDSYFSIVCLTVEIDRGRLVYASAGHPPPLLLRRRGGLEVLDHRGPVIGYGAGGAFRQAELELEPGDQVVLYTDGIFENRNRAGRPFGRERFYRTVGRGAGLPVAERVAAVFDEVRGFLAGAEPDDDISLFGIEYIGPPAA